MAWGAGEIGRPPGKAILPLTIADLQMPDDGWSFAHRIASDPAIAPPELILLIYGASSRLSRPEGAPPHLRKPVRQSKLYDAIATVMGAPAEREDAEANPAYEVPITAVIFEVAKAHSSRTAPAGPRAAADGPSGQPEGGGEMLVLGYRATSRRTAWKHRKRSLRIP